MKLSKVGLAVLVIPILAAIVALPFLPDTIPMQWSLTGKVNRWGSKYFILILAIVPYVVYSSIKNKNRR